MTNKNEFIKSSLHDSASVKIKTAELCEKEIILAVEWLVSSLKKKKKIMFCGNGGSAADSQHLATEFVIRLSHDIKRPAIPALALSTDSSFLTAGANDIGFENTFARAIEGLGCKGDVLIAISTSGNSPNIIKAVEKAIEMKILTIGFLGGNGGKLANMVNLPIIIPSNNVQRIQEGHITIGHIICELVERDLYSTQ